MSAEKTEVNTEEQLPRSRQLLLQAAQLARKRMASLPPDWRHMDTVEMAEFLRARGFFV